MRLQRYDIETGLYGNGYKPVRDDWGEWVISDDVEKLEKLNREMYETLKSIHFYLQQIGSVDSLLRNSLYQEQEAAVRKMLVKAEGREVQGE